MRVCVIGAGYAGLAAALTLARRNLEVTLIDAASEAGGLVAALQVNGTELDVYYRHIFRTDVEAIHWLKQYQLEPEWLDSRMGYFSRDRLFSFGKPQDLLTFQPLSWIGRLRFAIGTLRTKYHQNYHQLENETAEQFILRTSGRETYETIWKPLLLAKFGSDYNRVGAVWFWGKIALRSRSRDGSGLKEQLGYLEGSFSRLTRAMVQELQDKNVRIVYDTSSKSIQKKEDGSFIITTMTKGQEQRILADAVVSAIPLPEFLKLNPPIDETEGKRLEQIDFTAVSCMILQMKKPFTKYYWLNIGDRTIPFGGLIEHTNLVPASRYGDSRILYISHYLFSDDPHYTMNKEELFQTYLPSLQKINPSFSPDDVIEMHRGRTLYAQPIIKTGYAQLKPQYRTSVPGLFHVGMAHIYPEDRGMNYALKTGRLCAEEVSSHLAL